jgi:serine/threonine protein kinase
MSPGLDLRLQFDASAFCVLDKNYYEDLKRYTPSSTQYLDELSRHLEPAHELEKHGIWYHVRVGHQPVPAQGFKIHLSATCSSALKLLQAALPVLVKEQVAFKVVVDAFMLAFINAKNYSRSGSGKFVTVYPSEKQFAELIEKLSQATQGLSGPFILSDRRYGESGVVFYRYGGFVANDRLTVQGHRLSMIDAPDGKAVQDVRGPSFCLPNGVEDPFPRPAPTGGGTTSLRQRYSVESALTFSNAGGVYKGRDSDTGQAVVIKEARPLVGITNTADWDAIEVLRKEHRVLKALEGSGIVPRVIDYFREWEHEFLVEEFVGGMPLSRYRASDEMGLIANPHSTSESVASFCSRWFQIARELLEAVRGCHARNVLIGDLSPNNVLIDPETLRLRLIDMECAQLTTDPLGQEVNLFTPGFASQSRLSGSPLSPQDDYYALGCVLYSLILPVQPHFRMAPQASRMFLTEIAEDYGLPAGIPEVVFSLMEGKPERATAILELPSEEACTASEGLILSPALLDDCELEDLELQPVLDGISSHILSEANLQRRDRLWPGDYRLYTTNPLSLAYGAMGIALYLKAERRELPGSILDWILAQPVDCSSYPPGLYLGLAGIAWGLAELGEDEKAAATMKMAYRSPLLKECPDAFYGMAGTGLASLFFWQRTGDQLFLDSAVQLGEALLAVAQSEPAGYSWLSVDGAAHGGFAFGGSGIGLFLLYLYLTTGEARFLSYAEGAVDEEIAQGIEAHGSISWPRSKSDKVVTPYWQDGNAGIGSVLVRFGALLGEERYLEVARKAARYATGKYAVLPCQFIGLSGIGEFLLDMYSFTQNRRYLADARRLAAGIKLFQITTPSGIMFPAENLVRASLDYGTGSAGVGMYLRRLAHGGPRLFFDFLLSSRQPESAEPSLLDIANCGTLRP